MRGGQVTDFRPELPLPSPFSCPASEYHRLIWDCTRQWGKSTVTAAKAVHRAWSRAGSMILVVSPTEERSAEFLRKAEKFVGRLGVRPRGGWIPPGLATDAERVADRGAVREAEVVAGLLGTVADNCGRRGAGDGGAVSDGAADAGDDGRGRVDDEHSVGAARAVLGDVNERRARMDAGEREGDGVPAGIREDRLDCERMPERCGSLMG